MKNVGRGWYIIQSGSFEVLVDDKAVRQLRSKHSFGELAMLYSVPRTATVTSKERGVLWKMHADQFRAPRRPAVASRWRFKPIIGPSRPYSRPSKGGKSHEVPRCVWNS